MQKAFELRDKRNIICKKKKKSVLRIKEAETNHTKIT